MEGGVKIKRSTRNTNIEQGIPNHDKEMAVRAPWEVLFRLLKIFRRGFESERSVVDRNNLYRHSKRVDHAVDDVSLRLLVHHLARRREQRYP